MIKVAASLLSSLLFSLAIAYSDYVTFNQEDEHSYYTSFEYSFLFSITKLLFFYFVIVLPMSFYLDRLLFSQRLKYGAVSRHLIRIMGHAGAVAIVAIPLSYMLGMLPDFRYNFILACVAGMLVFLFVEYVLKFMVAIVVRGKHRQVKGVFPFFYLLLSIALVTGCTMKQEAASSDASRPEFFAWMDAYLAVENHVENAVAVTLYFEHEPYSSDEISTISFADIDNQVVINNFQVEHMKLPSSKYSAYAITLNYTAQQMGIFKTSGLIVSLKSNETIQYPVGNWTFDVGHRGADKVNTWDAPVTTSSGSVFPYQYTLNNTTGTIKKIYYGDQQYIEDDAAIDLQGTIHLARYYSAPIVYVKSKIVLSEGGKTFTDYGEGCYCGAVHFSKDVLEQSKIHNEVTNS